VLGSDLDLFARQVGDDADLSVFPFSPEAVEAARGSLAGFDLSKGTVRLTPDKPIPDSALEHLLCHRVDEIESRQS
jgi:uncharacterized protein YdhG (YjbR/CyaY superfamily)